VLGREDFRFIRDAVELEHVPFVFARHLRARRNGLGTGPGQTGEPVQADRMVALLAHVPGMWSV
jgi:hypothetical protein